MAGPGGVEVGKVSIRVVPDTSNFRRDLERELKAIQKSLKVEIPVEIDSKGALAKIAALKAQINSLGRGAKLNFSADGGLGNVEQSAKRINAEVKTLRGGLASALRGVKNLGKNGKSAFDSMRVGALLAGSSVKKFFTTNPFTNFLNGTKAVGRGFKGIGRGLLDMDLSFRKVRKSAVGLTKVIGSTGGILGKSLKSMANFATLGVSSFGKLGRIAKIFVAVLAAAPPLLGLIGGLIGGLPALLGAAGAAIGVIALGIDGIKAAFKGFSESLAPLKADISNIFEQGLTKQLQPVTAMLLKMKPQLESVAKGLLDMSQGFINAFTSAQGVTQINTLLSNTATFFSNLKPAMENFGKSFLTLASEGSKDFGLLSNVIGNFANSFNDMATRVAGNGSLHNALVGLSQVTDALLQGFVKLTETGIDAMGTLGGPLAGALTKLIDLIVQLIPVLTPVAQLILNLVGPIVDALTPALNAIQPLIAQLGTTLGNIIGPAVTALAPGFQALATFAISLANAFAPLLSALIPIATTISNVLLSALKALSPVLPVISDAMQKVADVINDALTAAMPTLNEIATALGQAIVDAVKALAPILPGLIDAFLKLVSAILPILPPLIQLIGAILPPLIQIFTTLIQPILQVATSLVSTLMPAITKIIGVVKDVIGAIMNFAKVIADNVAGVIRTVGSIGGKILGAVADFGSLLFKAGGDLLRGLVNGIGNLVGWVIDKVKGVGKSILNGIKSFFGINSPSKVFAEIGGFLMTGLAQGIDRDGNEAVKSAQDVADQINGVGMSMSTSIDANGGMTLQAERIESAISNALTGWGVEIDGQGMAKIVNKANRDNRTGR